MHEPMHTTPTFITEPFHFAACVHLFERNILPKAFNEVLHHCLCCKLFIMVLGEPLLVALIQTSLVNRTQQVVAT